VGRVSEASTIRAAWWAVSCIQRDTASVASVARRLGVDWHTVWAAIKPLLVELADDPDRLAGFDTVGVDEHLVRHEALLFRMEVRDLDRFAVAAGDCRAEPCQRGALPAGITGSQHPPHRWIPRPQALNG
jgi:hypothetical protein